jgi:GR25 family glycosyltransferase involved in LPS biosynthesis
LSSTERGCALSHINTWKLIASYTPKNKAEASQMSSGVNSYNGSTYSTCTHHVANRECLDFYSSMNSLLVSKIKLLNELNHIESYQEWFLIIEDDATISKKVLNDDFLPDLMHRLILTVPSDVDIVYLGHCIPKKAKISRHKKIWVMPNYIWELHAYLITQKTASILLSFLPVDCPVDNFISKLINEKILKVV